MDGETKLTRALSVMVLDARIHGFLAEHDPQALKQALNALGVESREELIERGRMQSLLDAAPCVAGHACERCGSRYVSFDDAQKCARRPFSCAARVADARARLDALLD